MKALILMHAAHEGPGSFGEVLQDNGASVTTVKFHENPDAYPVEKDFDLLLSLGGPMDSGDVANHPWLARETEMLGRAARDGKKVLGICLGSQILARGLGASVRPGTAREIGYAPIQLTDEGRDDPILAGLKPTETVLHWHSDQFEIPTGAVRLASSDATENQGFRLGRHAYGLQFHLEVNRALLEEWLANPAVRQELESTPGAPSADQLLAAAEEHEKRLRWLCTSVLSRLVNLI